MLEKSAIEKLIENLRDAENGEAIENALAHAGLIAAVAPRLPDNVFLQPAHRTGDLPGVILDWRSSDTFEDKETGEKLEGAQACFDLSVRRTGFFAQRKLQRVQITDELWMFADKTAVRTDSFERDKELIKIAFMWLDAEYQKQEKM